jgi:hypothetical protein
MDWKVDTAIANRNSGKRRPEGELPVWIASRNALSGARLAKSPERGGALTLVGMTPAEAALDTK